MTCNPPPLKCEDDAIRLKTCTGEFQRDGYTKYFNHCGVCGAITMNLTEKLKHLGGSRHRNAYLSLSRSFIRRVKINGHYYCSVCEKHIPTDLDVELHLSGGKHEQTLIRIIAWSERHESVRLLASLPFGVRCGPCGTENALHTDEILFGHCESEKHIEKLSEENKYEGEFVCKGCNTKVAGIDEIRRHLIGHLETIGYRSLTLTKKNGLKMLKENPWLRHDVTKSKPQVEVLNPKSKPRELELPTEPKEQHADDEDLITRKIVSGDIISIMSPLFYCKICDMVFEMQIDFKTHLEGSLHSQSFLPETEHFSDFCLDCQRLCRNYEEYNTHLVSIAHQKMLNSLADEFFLWNKNTGEYYCEPCMIIIESRDDLIGHRATNSHLRSIEASMWRSSRAPEDAAPKGNEDVSETANSADPSYDQNVDVMPCKSKHVCCQICGEKVIKKNLVRHCRQSIHLQRLHVSHAGLSDEAPESEYAVNLFKYNQSVEFFCSSCNMTLQGIEEAREHRPVDSTSVSSVVRETKSVTSDAREDFTQSRFRSTRPRSAYSNFVLLSKATGSVIRLKRPIFEMFPREDETAYFNHCEVCGEITISLPEKMRHLKSSRHCDAYLQLSKAFICKDKTTGQCLCSLCEVNITEDSSVQLHMSEGAHSRVLKRICERSESYDPVRLLASLPFGIECEACEHYVFSDEALFRHCDCSGHINKLGGKSRKHDANFVCEGCNNTFSGMENIRRHLVDHLEMLNHKKLPKLNVWSCIRIIKSNPSLLCKP